MADHMNSVDRVMRAYRRKHTITESQAKVIRAEVSKFIDELLERRQLEFTWPERRRALGQWSCEMEPPFGA
jgi:hypothetical protein